MSDIPDWLVELAAQGGQDEEDTEATVGAEDALEGEAADSFMFATEPERLVKPEEMTPSAEESEEGAPEDLMESLRSQMEAEAALEDMEEAEPRRSINLRIPGLLAWQQLVLTVLLFLDVIVIGLLFLVMTGRMAIP